METSAEVFIVLEEFVDEVINNCAKVAIIPIFAHSPVDYSTTCLIIS